MQRYLMAGSVIFALQAISAARGADIDAGQRAYDRRDYGVAAHEWLLLADAGDVAAAASLGMLYDTGNGIRQDFVQALQWYRRAAEGGDASAMLNVAVMLDSGRGTPVDRPQAAEWYRAAANSGNARAAYDLALLYEQGDGVQQDPAQAARLFALAAKRGILAARQKLAVIAQTVAKEQPGIVFASSPRLSSSLLPRSTSSVSRRFAPSAEALTKQSSPERLEPAAAGSDAAQTHSSKVSSISGMPASDPLPHTQSTEDPGSRAPSVTATIGREAASRSAGPPSLPPSAPAGANQVTTVTAAAGGDAEPTPSASQSSRLAPTSKVAEDRAEQAQSVSVASGGNTATMSPPEPPPLPPTVPTEENSAKQDPSVSAATTGDAASTLPASQFGTPAANSQIADDLTEQTQSRPIQTATAGGNAARIIDVIRPSGQPEPVLTDIDDFRRAEQKLLTRTDVTPDSVELRALLNATSTLQKQAARGEARAQYDLGYCYERGIGVETDRVRAYIYYFRALWADPDVATRVAATKSANAILAHLTDGQLLAATAVLAREGHTEIPQ